MSIHLHLIRGAHHRDKVKTSSPPTGIPPNHNHTNPLFDVESIGLFGDGLLEQNPPPLTEAALNAHNAAHQPFTHTNLDGGSEHLYGIMFQI